MSSSESEGSDSDNTILNLSLNNDKSPSLEEENSLTLNFPNSNPEKEKSPNLNSEKEKSANRVNNTNIRLDMEVKVSLNDVYNIVPEFDGNPNELEKFISCGNLLFTNGQKESEAETFLKLVMVRLKGSAFEAIQYKTINKWEILCKELRSRFQEEKSRSAAQNELAAVRQNYKESVKDFGERCIQLLNKLNGATYSNIKEDAIRNYLMDENAKLAVQTFEDGFRSHSLRLLVKSQNVTDLKILINYAMEQAVRLERNESGNNASKINQNSSQRIICQICQKPGHTRERCFQNLNSPRYSGRNPTQEASRIICSYCGKPNHTQREC